MNCPVCGSWIDDLTDGFCDQCGALLDDDRAPAAVSALPPPP